MNVDAQLNDGNAGPVARIPDTPWSHLVGTNQGDCLKTAHIEPVGEGLPRHLLGDLARASTWRTRRPRGACDETPTIESAAEIEARVRLARRARARRRRARAARAREARWTTLMTPLRPVGRLRSGRGPGRGGGTWEGRPGEEW